MLKIIWLCFLWTQVYNRLMHCSVIDVNITSIRINANDSD